MSSQVHEIRKRLGLTQAAMAEALGLTTRALHDIENGHSKERAAMVLAAQHLEAQRFAEERLSGLAPMDAERAAFALQRIAGYREDIVTAQRSIDLIDAGEMTFHQATGDQPLHDCTAERRADCVKRIAVLEEAIRIWSRDLPPEAIEP